MRPVEHHVVAEVQVHGLELVIVAPADAWIAARTIGKKIVVKGNVFAAQSCGKTVAPVHGRIVESLAYKAPAGR